MEILADSSNDFSHGKQKAGKITSGRILDQVLLVDNNNFYDDVGILRESAFKLEFSNSNSTSRGVNVAQDLFGRNNRLIASVGLVASNGDGASNSAEEGAPVNIARVGDCALKVDHFRSDSAKGEVGAFFNRGINPDHGFSVSKAKVDLPSLDSLPCFKLLNCSGDASSSDACILKRQPKSGAQDLANLQRLPIGHQTETKSFTFNAPKLTDVRRSTKIILRILKSDPLAKNQNLIQIVPHTTAASKSMKNLDGQPTQMIYSNCFSVPLPDDQNRLGCSKTTDPLIDNNVKREHSEEEFHCDDPPPVHFAFHGDPFDFSDVRSSNERHFCDIADDNNGAISPSDASPLPLIGPACGFGSDTPIHSSERPSSMPFNVFNVPPRFIHNVADVPSGFPFGALNDGSTLAMPIQPVGSMFHQNGTPPRTVSHQALKSAFPVHNDYGNNAVFSQPVVSTFQGRADCHYAEGSPSVLQPVTSSFHTTSNVQHCGDGTGGGARTFASQPATATFYANVNGRIVVLDRAKLERKRERNRTAATKCRRRKLERIAALQGRVDDLATANGRLRAVLKARDEEVRALRRAVGQHRGSGCNL